ncbi:hypothetical protein FRB90_003808 [Tulasnella sp. 427]|nr:hypothetical protein FRB90_003808 [Tulasnella sp. 427]
MRPSISRIPARFARPHPSLLSLRSTAATFPKFKPHLQQSRWNSSSKSEKVPPIRGPSKPPTDGTNAQRDGYEAQSIVQQPLNLPTGVSDGSSVLAGATPLLGATLTTVIGLAVVFVGGVFYFEWYKANVIRKMEMAFEAGYDPALNLADHGIKTRASSRMQATDGVDWASDVRRDEQDVIDEIVHGMRHGHYILLMGSKGVGKTTMILDAMRRVEADGVAICEAHEDLEVFRLRLGKALNYEYNEDSQTGLFQRRDPREGGPRLDIERALNKLEKVALKMAAQRKKPLVLVINNCQLFDNAEETHQLLLQLQQKAESWAESHLITVVFRKIQNRMRVIPVRDLHGTASLSALRHLRQQHFGKAEDDSVLLEVLKIVGGRLSRMNSLAREDNIVDAANRMLNNEKGWILSLIGLIPDCDDDVMDEQKVAASSWTLLREFAKRFREKEAELKANAKPGEVVMEPEMPAISYYEVRQIMTRADFVDMLDHQNIINIDTDHMVRPDSMVVLRAAIEVVEEEGFDELLGGVKDRIDAIESLHRTRELTWKASDNEDTVRIMLQPYEKREADKEKEKEEKEKAGRRGWWPFT